MGMISDDYKSKSTYGYGNSGSNFEDNDSNVDDHNIVRIKFINTL